MAYQGIIDNIISQKAIDQISQLTVSLTKVEDLIITINNNSSKPSSKPNNKPYDELANALNKIAKLETDIANIQAKQTTEIGKATQKITGYTVAKQALNKQNKLEATAVNENVGAYSRLAAQYEIAKRVVLDLAAAGITSGQAFESAKNEATRYEKELGNVHTASAQYGKAARQMYGSTYSLTQVMREMPNFMIDARIGFMSLSNNLPMLKDDFDKLRASGMSTGQALKTFGKSLLSANTAIIVGITLMVAYGDKVVDWFGKLIKGENAAGSFGAKMEVLNKIMKDNGGAAKSSLVNLESLGIILEKAVNGTYDANSAVEEYNKTLGIHYGKVNNVKDAMNSYVRNSSDYIRSIINQTAAMQTMESASTTLIKRFKIDEQLNQIPKIAELNSKYMETVSIAKNVKGGLSELLTYMQNPMTEGFGDVKGGYESLNKSFRELFKIEGGDDFTKLMAKRSKLTNELNGTIKTSKSFMDKMSLSVTKNTETSVKNTDESSKIKDVVEKNVEAVKNWESELLKADDIISGISIDAESVFGKEDKQTIYQSHKEALSGATQALKDANKEYLDELYSRFELEEIARKNEKDLLKQNEDEKYNIMYESVNSMQDLVDGITDYYIKNLDEQSEANNDAEDDKLKKLEENHDNGLISDEDYESKKSSIEEYYQNKSDDLDKKQAEAEKKAFLLSQAFAIADIWIKYSQTLAAYERAKAEMAAISGGILTPAAEALYTSLQLKALVMASIQTAAVAAQTIPAFEKGGDMDHDGIARVSERHSEIGVTPSGEFFMTPNDESLMFLEKGTHIFPDASSFNNSSISKMVMINSGMNFSTEKLEKKLDILTIEVKKLKQQPQKSESLMEKIKFARTYKLS